MNIGIISPTLFRGTSGPRDATIAVVGESYGRVEAEKNLPLVGESGNEFDKILAECGIARNSVFCTNVINEKPPSNEMYRFFYPTKEARSNHIPSIRGLYPRDNVIEGLSKLQQQLAAVNPDIIIALGNYALWALTDSNFYITDRHGYKVPTGISAWRGSQLRTSEEFGSRKLLPVYHPAAALRTFAWRPMIVHDIKTRIKASWELPEENFTIRPSFDQIIYRLNWFLERLAQGPFDLACDLETRGGLIATCGFAWSPHDAISIPFMCVERDLGYLLEEEELEIVKLLRAIFSHPNLRLIGQNFLYDLSYIYEYFFVKPTITFDTMYTHHLCWPGGGDPQGAKSQAQGIQQKSLYNLSSLYCNHHVYWKDEGKEWHTSLPEEQLWQYNCRDAVKTFEIAQVLRKLVEALGFQEQFKERMDTVNEVIAEMQLRGIRADTIARDKLASDLEATTLRIGQEIDSLIPEDVYPRKKKASPWFRSPKQQQEIFYEILGIRPVKIKGKATLSKDAIPMIASREPLVGQILDKVEIYRSITTRLGSVPTMLLTPDNRLRSSLKPAGTDTFRLASSEDPFGFGGNLQNVSSGDEDEEEDELRRFPNMRRAFIPDPGYELVEVDLAGADAQVVAWEANDEDLKAAFKKGLKLHIKNARDVYPELTENLTDDEIKAQDHLGGIYHNCKRRVHGVNYIASPKTMATKLRTSIKLEEEFRERWFYLHPGIEEWHRRVEANLYETRSVWNKFGYRIVYFDRIEGILPRAVAWGPQSTVAINCLRGGLAIRRKFPFIQLLLQIHDSLVFQIPIECHNELGAIVATLNSITVPYKPEPLTIPWSVKVSRNSLGEMEGIEL